MTPTADNPSAAPPFRYAVMLDAPPPHACWIENLLFSLEKFGGARRSAMQVQCTPAVDSDTRRRLQDAGYCVSAIDPGEDAGPNTGTARQITLLGNLDHALAAQPPTHGIFLLAQDTAAAAAISLPDSLPATDHICAKLVHSPDPPLESLQRLFSAAGVPLPDIVPSDSGSGDTLATHVECGVLYVPTGQARALRTSWRRWAGFLREQTELVDALEGNPCPERLSLALALVDGLFPLAHLPANWNYPCGAPETPRSLAADEPLRIVRLPAELDDFGQIATPAEADAPLRSVVARINTAIGYRTDSVLFDDFKRRRAQQAIADLPPLPPPAATAAEPAAPAPPPRSLLNLFGLLGRRKPETPAAPARVILHVGTPRTGAASLQRHLNDSRERLAEHGWWYPPSAADADEAGAGTDAPKHGQLLEALASNSGKAVADCLNALLADRPPDTHSVVLTAEGIYSHWRDFGAHAKAALRDFSAARDFSLCAWFREPSAFAASLYAQCIQNPRSNDAQQPLDGRDIDFSAALDEGWFRRQLDYLGFYYEVQELFGPERVQAFLYGRDTVRRFCAHYGIDCLPKAAVRHNASMRSAGVDMMRVVNRFGLDADTQREAQRRARELEAVIGKRNGPFTPHDAERARIMRYAGRGWALLAQSIQSQGQELKQKR